MEPSVDGRSLADRSQTLRRQSRMINREFQSGRSLADRRVQRVQALRPLAHNEIDARGCSRAPIRSGDGEHLGEFLRRVRRHGCHLRQYRQLVGTVGLPQDRLKLAPCPAVSGQFEHRHEVVLELFHGDPRFRVRLHESEHLVQLHRQRSVDRTSQPRRFGERDGALGWRENVVHARDAIERGDEAILIAFQPALPGQIGDVAIQRRIGDRRACQALKRVPAERGRPAGRLQMADRCVLAGELGK